VRYNMGALCGDRAAVYPFGVGLSTWRWIVSKDISEKFPLTRTVALIGLMGAGKTQIGRGLSQALGAPFIDADAEIEAAAGRSITDIFETFGEPHFREGERQVIQRLLDGPPCILATGGGAFVQDKTRALIETKAVSLWLKADLELLVARTAGKSHRPLLRQGAPREVLQDLMNRRYPVYAKADIIVETKDEPPQATTARVLAALKSYFMTHARTKT